MIPSEPDASAERGAPVHRLAELLGAEVVDAAGRRLGHVNDVRFVAGQDRGHGQELTVAGLVVAGRHAGSLLGYDRRPSQGPWLVRAVVRRLHRHAGYVPWTEVRHVAWADRRVEVASGPRPLS
jgi:sporulation protein YlmC with PRC-barrel domain